MSELFKFEKDDRGVATVTLNRPALHNAFNDELIEKLTKKLSSLDSDIRVLVLTGEGRSFSAGADLNWMKSMKDYSLEDNLKDSEKLALLFKTINELKIPVIGKINGAALGGGGGLVAVCDYVIASDHAKFGFTEVKLGLIPAVISPYVIAKIGESNARAYFLSGARFSAETAKNIGLVHQVEKDDYLNDKTEKVVKDFLSAAPIATGYAKQLIHEVLSKSDSENFKYTTEFIAKVRVSEEAKEGMTALLEKRKASWVTDEN